MSNRAPIMMDGAVVGYISLSWSQEIPVGEGLPPSVGLGQISASPGAGQQTLPGAPHHHRRLGGDHAGTQTQHHRYLDPANRERQAEHERPHVKHGPTFRPGMTPRGSAEPAKPDHFSTGDVLSAVKGENNLRGSAYLQHERSWIKDELSKDASLQRYLRGVLAHEQSPGERSKVMESLANRLNMLRKTEPGLTLKEYLSRTGESQFYGPIKRGEINESWLREHADGAEGAATDREIAKVLGGSNDIRGMTDQGSAGDPNFGRGETIMSNGEGYNDFAGDAGRRYREEQQRRVAQGGSAGVNPVGVTRLPAGPIPKGEPTFANTGKTAAMPSGAMLAATGQAPEAFIMHHTGGGRTPEDIQNILRKRGLGVEYIMDRNGNITQAGNPGASHMLPGWGKGAGLSNQNTVGMEVIARDNKDVTQKQIESAKRFIREKYPNIPVYGHGEVNPGHKEADEGMAITNAIRKERAVGAASPIAAGDKDAESPKRYRDGKFWRAVDAYSKALGELPQGVPRPSNLPESDIVKGRPGFVGLDSPRMPQMQNTPKLQDTSSPDYPPTRAQYKSDYNREPTTIQELLWYQAMDKLQKQNPKRFKELSEKWKIRRRAQDAADEE